AAGKPVVTGLRYGQGYVIALSSLYPFTNVGLRDPAAAALLLNIVSWLPSGERIVFDEFHHGFGPATNLRTLLAAVRPIDREGLRRILAALRRADLNETGLLALVAEADRLG
ncbi:MAG: DUF4350 domain-containing protein, partial [Chloroflexus aggregans]